MSSVVVEKPIVSNAINCPTKPLVPMPAPASLLVMRNMPTAMGAVTMPANVGGTRMRGFFTILPICNMEVPKPCAMSPLMPFSL